jgi:hypothetical protein
MPDTTPQTNTQPENIFAQIRKEQQDFMFNWISIVPGYPFNQYYTIKKAHLYLNSKYEDGSQYNGRDKLFFNVVIPPCEVAMRMLNLDTKNIRLWPLSPKSYFSTYLLEKELKFWLKKHKLGQILNQLAAEAPRFGSVVLEKTPDGANVVDLRRLILDPTVEKIQDSRFVTTIAYMTPTQLRDTNWDQDAVERSITQFSNQNATEPYEDQWVNVNVMRSTPYIKVFKRYGEVPTWWVDDSKKPGTKSGDALCKALFIVAGADWVQKNNDGKPVSDLGAILFKSKWVKDWPFKDFHYMKTKGRWLGIGIVEMLFDVQVRVNEMKNQKRVGMELSQMHLFQTKDKSIVRNVLTDLQSGDLMLSPNGIEPINNSQARFSEAEFKNEEDSYQNQIDKLSFAYEALRGDTGDASTPLGTTQIAVAQGTSVFAFKKENLALFLQDYFNDLVLPQLMKDLTPEHIMRFVGNTQELQKLDDAASDVYANDYVKKRILAGQFTVQEDFDTAKQKAVTVYQKLGDNRFLKIKDAFYDDAEFEFDFMITNEQADPAKMATNIQAVLAEVPNLNMQDPMIKLLFGKLCEQLGISQGELELAQQQSDQQAQQAQAQQMQMQQQGQPPQPGGASVGGGFSANSLMRLASRGQPAIPTVGGLSKIN